MVAPARAPLRPDRLRAVNAPREVAVQVDEFGLPMTAGLPDGPTARIESVNETWRIDDEWWRQMISRQYFEVMMEGGKRMVLFQDLINGKWFAQLP
jgi:hypothetical protein